MSETLEQVSLETGLHRLENLFSGFNGAVYLRGSLLRREPPYDDIDVLEISDKPSQDLNDIPAQFMGAKVAYRHLTLNQWDEYLKDCPRSWYMFYDIALLRSGIQAEATFSMHKNRFFSDKEPDGVAYDHYDSLSSRGHVIDFTRNEYEYAKCIPGSKRSMMRSVFTLKALYPEYRNFTTPELLNSCALSGKIPEDIPTTAQNLYSMLSHDPIVIRDVNKVAARCASWMLELSEITNNYIQERLPESYNEALAIAAISEEPVELSYAHEVMQEQLLPHRHWTLAYLLVKNSNTSLAIKKDIADYYRRGYVGRLIRDVLAKRHI